MAFQKKREGLFILSLLSILMFLFLTTVLIDTENAYGDSDSGKKLFDVNCAVCHGIEGDSKGQVCFSSTVEKSGRVIETAARDFTVGVFRFRSTPTGCLPTDDDVVRIFSNGIPKSFMPSFNDLSQEDKKAVLEYVKTFSERWEEEEPCDAMPVVKPSWVGSPDSVNRGKEVYKKVKCWECHGNTGKGDGVKSDELKDDWGKKIVPFDFTSGTLKRGAAAEDVYITFSTGLDGSGMPSYEDSLGEDNRWHLVSYTLKLMGKAK